MSNSAIKTLENQTDNQTNKTENVSEQVEQRNDFSLIVISAKLYY